MLVDVRRVIRSSKNSGVSITARSTGDQGCVFLIYMFGGKIKSESPSRRGRGKIKKQRAKVCQVSFRPEAKFINVSCSSHTPSCESIRDFIRHSCQQIVSLASAACQPRPEISA